MLSKPAFNALLKTLEEPPPHSLFVFATTIPENIPFTVVSRCQRYDLRRIAVPEIVDRLRLIAGAEGVEVSDKSLLAIAREADGSLRDAQTLLDQVISFGGTQIDDAQVAGVLDLIDRRLLLAILEACVEGDAARGLEACGRAAESGAEAKRLGENLLGLLRDLVVLHIAPEAQLVEGSQEEVAELRTLAGRTDAMRLRRMFRSLVKEQEDLAWAPQPFAVLEMAVVRLATMPAGDEVAKLLTRLDALEQRLDREPGASGGPTGSPPSGDPKAPAPRKRRPKPEPQGAATAKPPDAPPEAVFERLRDFAGKGNPGLFATLEGGRLVERDDDHLRIAVSQRFLAQRLEDRRGALEKACADFFGRGMRVEIETDGGEPSGPSGPDAESLRQLRQAALNHPAVPGGRDRGDPPDRRRAVNEPDLGQLMAKAREMQSRLAELQRELAQRRAEGSAGAGMVTAVATGELRILEVRIESSLVESGDREMIQDLTAAAVNAALANAQRMIQDELQRVSGGLAITTPFPFGGG
jgi:DNA polymerase-3 subunit gamma/tau